MFSKQLAGGAVVAGDALRITAQIAAPFSEPAQFALKLGNVELFNAPLSAGSMEVVEVLCWREAGSRSGFAGGWRIGTGPVVESTNFNWTGPMVLQMAAQSAELGGAILGNIFVER